MLTGKKLQYAYSTIYLLEGGQKNNNFSSGAQPNETLDLVTIHPLVFSLLCKFMHWEQSKQHFQPMHYCHGKDDGLSKVRKGEHWEDGLLQIRKSGPLAPSQQSTTKS